MSVNLLKKTVSYAKMILFCEDGGMVDALLWGGSGLGCGSSNLLLRTIGKLVELIDFQNIKVNFG